MQRTPLSRLLAGSYDTQTLDVSTEMIRQQRTDFFDAITEVMSKVNGVKLRELANGDFEKDILACVEKYMNLSLKLDLGDTTKPRGSVPFYAGFIHPSGSKFQMSRRDAEQLNQKFLTLQFDTSTPYIKGDARKLPLSLGLDTSVITGGKLSSQELAAIVMHELGHLWTMLFMVTRVSYVNIALQEIAKFTNETPDPIKRQASYEVLCRDLTQLELSQLKTKIDFSASGDAIVTFVAAEFSPVLFADLGSPEYGRTMDEHAADTFATRFGAGKYLVTALEKLNKGYRDYVVHARAMSNYQFFSGLLEVLAGGALMAAGIVGAGVIFALGGIISTATSLLDITPSGAEYLYDRNIDRYKRIRNQLQLRMRESADSKAAVDIFRDELVAVDRIIARMDDKDSFFTGFLVNLFFGSVRRRNRQAELELYFEDLGHNRLFDSAMRFKFV